MKMSKQEIPIWRYIGNRYISKLILNDIKYVGPNAFADCKKLSKLIINGEKAILDCGCFSYCDSLEVIELNNILEIRESAFSWCIRLNTLDIRVPMIGEGAFFHCKNLKNITIAENVVRISSRAFCACENLESVIFKGMPEYFGDDIFYDVKKDAKIYINNTFQEKMNSKKSEIDFWNRIKFVGN